MKKIQRYAEQCASVLSPWQVIVGSIATFVTAVALLGALVGEDEPASETENNRLGAEVSSGVAPGSETADHGTALSDFLQATILGQFGRLETRCSLDGLSLQILSETPKQSGGRASVIWDYTLEARVNGRLLMVTGRTNGAAESLESARIDAVGRVAEKFYSSEIVKEECGDET